MKVLIIGYGSIAKKHVEALRRINTKWEFFALRHSTTSEKPDGINNIYEWNEIPKDLSFVIISNPTSEHYKTILKTSELGVPIFIEKPPIAKLSDTDQVLKVIHENNCIAYCAFNLRFHPVIEWLKKNINPSDVIELTAYCGSYLPDWRPNTDYRKTYSANNELGGGVHLDLIHELDYIKWILGNPLSTNGTISQISSLEIDVPDYAHYTLRYEKSISNITLNYYRKIPKRSIDIVLNNSVVNADLINHKITDGNDKIIFSAENDLIGIYERQMRYFISCIAEDKQPMNSLKEAIETLEIALNVKMI